MPPQRVCHKRLRRLWKRGLTLVQMAAELGVSRSAVKENLARLGLVRGKGWKPPGHSRAMSRILLAVHARKRAERARNQAGAVRQGELIRPDRRDSRHPVWRHDGSGCDDY